MSRSAGWRATANHDGKPTRGRPHAGRVAADGTAAATPTRPPWRAGRAIGRRHAPCPQPLPLGVSRPCKPLILRSPGWCRRTGVPRPGRPGPDPALPVPEDSRHPDPAGILKQVSGTNQDYLPASLIGGFGQPAAGGKLREARVAVRRKATGAVDSGFPKAETLAYRRHPPQEPEPDPGRGLSPDSMRSRKASADAVELDVRTCCTPFGMMHGIAQTARARVARQPDASAAAATVSTTASRISCSGQYWLAGW
jgi:hypothetical protein